MAKTIGTLEKEVALWRARYEKTNKSLIETTEEVSASWEFQCDIASIRSDAERSQ